ncbi:MAG: GTPase HflX [Chloroflexota bacterium]
MAVDLKKGTGSDTFSVESSLDELAQLAESAGALVVGHLTQRLSAPFKAHYIGTGKLEELILLQGKKNFNVVIFDDELTPLQQMNLEKELKVKVIDRATLILDIFSKRAKTSEGQLQVELAQLEYLLPRLTGQWSHLERLGGGIGTRGPGESQLETDRRLIQRRINTLKKKIEEVRKQRDLYRTRRRRSGIPVISLVGYTNAGKSTLLNSLTRADVLARNQPFSTLDPTTRRLTLPDKRTVLMTDTVGFIQKLPPTIITAFRATLEELSEASLLVHVVDLTSHNAAEQCQTVEDILTSLGVAEKPRITVLNKIDLLLDKNRIWDEAKAMEYMSSQGTPTNEKTLFVSAHKGWGLVAVKKLVSAMLMGKESLLS